MCLRQMPNGWMIMLAKMNKLMNLMNLMKRKGECGALVKNMRVIFYFYWYLTAFLGSQRFIRFINLAMRNKKRVIVRQLTHTNNYLMNLMNVYVVRVLKSFFEKVALMDEDLMKWLCSVSSSSFIN
jgi:hypothetical protein